MLSDQNEPTGLCHGAGVHRFEGTNPLLAAGPTRVVRNVPPGSGQNEAMDGSRCISFL